MPRGMALQKEAMSRCQADEIARIADAAGQDDVTLNVGTLQVDISGPRDYAAIAAMEVASDEVVRKLRDRGNLRSACSTRN